MNKRVFIVHGWGGYPQYGWFGWLIKELEARGFVVWIPQLPDTNNPKIEPWVEALANVVGLPDENTYFIGYSMGCQTIVRYLERLSDVGIVGGAVFVAGFFKRLTGLENEPNGNEIAKHWLDTPLDLARARAHLSHSVAIFSDNDPYVPLDNQDDFSIHLGSKIIIEHNKGHFSEGLDGTRELPIVLNTLMQLCNESLDKK